MLTYALDQPYIPQRMLVSLDTGKLIDNMNDLMKLYAPRFLLQVLTFLALLVQKYNSTPPRFLLQLQALNY
jgi:hypothetical protein